MFHNENKENYDETNMNKRKVINCDKNKNDNISFAFNKLLNYKQKKFKEISLSFPHYSNLSTKKLKFANKDDIKLKIPENIISNFQVIYIHISYV